MPVEMITSAQALQEVARALSRECAVAVDLEADAMYHFQERICLLQLATPRRVMVVDPLATGDLTALRPLFANTRIRKVFHGADYDVRSLFRDAGIVIRNMFDTQIAARFLGARETGLEAVLRSRFRVKLDKRYQKRDWSLRPLPPEMISYAAMDVTFLLPLTEMLRAELETTQRSEWVSEECALLSRVRPAMDNGGPLFLRFKGAGALDRRGLAVLEALLQYRRQWGERHDRPVFKVLGNESLLQLANQQPRVRQALTSGGGLSPKQVSIHGAALLECIDQALSLPEEQLPSYPRQASHRIDPQAAERVQQLKLWRDQCAAALDLDPAIVLTRAAMQAIAERMPTRVADLAELPDMRRWQQRVLGSEIIALLRQMPQHPPSTGKRRRRSRPRKSSKQAVASEPVS